VLAEVGDRAPELGRAWALAHQFRRAPREPRTAGCLPGLAPAHRSALERVGCGPGYTDSPQAAAVPWPTRVRRAGGNSYVLAPDSISCPLSRPSGRVRNTPLKRLKMRNLLTAAVLAMALGGVSVAHGQPGGAAGPSGKALVAVVEFTPGASASGMTAEAKRQLQASIAFSLMESHRFDVVDVRRTRAASQGALPAVNGDASTEAAVQVGKQLGVSYVLTGLVTDYTAKGDDGFGHATFRTRLVEVATGAVRYAGETAHTGTSAMRTTGAAEMQTKVLKPAVEKLTATLVAKL
jgi:hypothetical protein